MAFAEAARSFSQEALLHRTALLEKGCNRLGQPTVSCGIWMDIIRLEGTIGQNRGQGLFFDRDLHFHRGEAGLKPEIEP